MNLKTLPTILFVSSFDPLSTMRADCFSWPPWGWASFPQSPNPFSFSFKEKANSILSNKQHLNQSFANNELNHADAFDRCQIICLNQNQNTDKII